MRHLLYLYNSTSKRFMKKAYLQLLLLLFAPPLGLFAQSPANLNENIDWNAGFSTIQDIENAYNHARREEETQLGLAVNNLGNLTLPHRLVFL